MPFDKPGQAPDRARREALLFAILFAIAYAALALTFFTQAPACSVISTGSSTPTSESGRPS